MSKTKPTTIQIKDIPGESDLESTLRVAAAIIRAHAPEALVVRHSPAGEDPYSGNEIADELESELEDLTRERENAEKSVTIFGAIIQAGGKPNPTITIATSERELSGTPIPFYKSCDIRITPARH